MGTLLNFHSSDKASFGLLWQSKLWTPLTKQALDSFGKASFGLLSQQLCERGLLFGLVLLVEVEAAAAD
jgi:hypothetical protein